MRRTRTRATARLMRVGMHRIVALVGDDRRRVIDVAELDVEIIRQRLKIRRAEVRRRARDVAGVGLFDRELGDRAPLQVVAFEQSGPSKPFEDVGKLPRQIVRVVNTGVAAEAAVRRHQMRGVAREENPALRKLPGDVETWPASARHRRSVPTDRERPRRHARIRSGVFRSRPWRRWQRPDRSADRRPG